MTTALNPDTISAMDEKLDQLRMNLRIGLKVAPMPFLRAFSGTGPNRRRETIGAREVADRLAKHIGFVHSFYEGAGRAGQDDLADFLFEHLKAVPDEVARGVTESDRNLREVSLDLISDMLTKALGANWIVRYEPGEQALPGQGVKFHTASTQKGPH